MRRDEQDAMTAMIRSEIGAEVDAVLDNCQDHHALQGEAAQLTVEFVREKLNAIFVSQDDDDT